MKVGIRPPPVPVQGSRRMQQAATENPTDVGESSSTLGARLHRLRLAQGITRNELGRAAGCSRQYIEMLETGDRGHPSAELIAALAAALDLRGLERDGFFVAGGVPPPPAAPDDRFDALTLAKALAEAQSCPAFVIDSCWVLLGWNELAQRIFEVYIPGLPAGATRLHDIVYGLAERGCLLNAAEVTMRLAAAFKRDTRPYIYTAAYRESLASLRRLPGFAAIYKSVKPSATATSGSPLGLRHSRLGSVWLAEAITELPGRNAPRVLTYLPADPATARVLRGDGRPLAGC
jgi:transcriptional regulator with XRE-family HTH domain